MIIMLFKKYFLFFTNVVSLQIFLLKAKIPVIITKENTYIHSVTEVIGVPSIHPIFF